MKALAQNWVLIVLVLLVLTVGGLIIAKKNKDKKQEEIRQIRDKINQGIGANGTDAGSILYNVKPDVSFNGLPFAKQIYDAKSSLPRLFGYDNDDEPAVYKALSGKTKAQLKSIEQAFLTQYGLDLSEYLRSFLDEEEQVKANQLMQNAA